jgi:hypothetical protein
MECFLDGRQQGSACETYESPSKECFVVGSCFTGMVDANSHPAWGYATRQWLIPKGQVTAYLLGRKR